MRGMVSHNAPAVASCLASVAARRGVHVLAFSSAAISSSSNHLTPQPVVSTTQLFSTAPKVSSRSLQGAIDEALDEGRPSFPGWSKQQLNELTDWAVADAANRPIIREYEPDALWLWSQYQGTVLKLVIVPVLIAGMASGMLDVAVHNLSGSSWSVLTIPPADDPIIQQLQGINKLWSYMLTLCTFLLTFFTAEAYKHWRTVYFTTRAIQGRINDICLLVTVGAEREDCDASKMLAFDSNTSGYSSRGEVVVDKVTRMVKLSHTFFWAATPTGANGVVDASNEDLDAGDIEERAIGPLLLSPEGLQELVKADEITKEERESLLNSGLSPTQYCYVLLQWVGLHVMHGLQSGALRGGNGLEENLLRQITQLRAEYFTIGDQTSGRMPLAYMQLLQVLTDSLVILSPLAIYPELGTLSIPATMLLCYFFKGQLELSKSFLDPFGNESVTKGQNLRVDVLVSELNFGANSRWQQAGAALPFNEFDY